MIDEKCIKCKHEKFQHAISLCGVHVCVSCYAFACKRFNNSGAANYKSKKRPFEHVFLTDNLKYIEELAKEKKLV